ncbi:carcinine transporter [Rhodnius prolixus]|uniref:carcinine transporter n=1 Tax=Rhodnius prolixus TaxID=13249 RepID=UPI003D18A33A
MGTTEPNISVNLENMDLDELLPQVGEFGKYQKLLLWLVCLPACVPCGFCAFNQLFMADVPDHWCRQPQLEGIVDAKQALRLAIPFSSENNETYAKCRRYNVNWTDIIENQSINVSLIIPNTSWPTEPCYDGWIYNTTQVPYSIVIDFNLVCGKDIYPTIGLAVLNLGGPFGVYIFGIVNDRYGRRKSFFICLFILITGNVLTAIAPNFYVWAVTRLIVGFTVPAIYQIPFIISLELVGPNYRSFVTVMTCLFYTFGLMLLSGITYLVREWRILALITSSPFILYYIYWWFLPESPRWLLAKGNFEDALTILENLAKVNKKVLPVSFKQKLKQKMMIQRTLSEEKRLKKGIGISSLFKTPNMRLKTILITLNWFANEMVYVGLSYYGPALGKDQYLSFLLSSAVEIPSYLFCWLIMDRWGRRWPLSISMILSGVSCIATVLLPSDAVTLTLMLFLFSKFTISASFLIIYPFAGELYPTQVRGIGIGTSAYISGLGLILIPFINYLGSENLVLPLVILGGISVFGGLTSLRLPETLHHKLPQTIEEGEAFGNDWNFKDCLRCIPLRPIISRPESYEDLEMASVASLSKETFSESSAINPKEKVPRRLVRQTSIMETPLDSTGSMKITYWF